MGVLGAILLLAAGATAHTAAPPLGHEVRLLHDCNDDYFGSDAFGGQTGHELHALDLYEAWQAGLGNVVVFKLTLAGEGEGKIDLTFKAGSSSKAFQWSTSGSTWSGNFDAVEGPFQAKRADGTADGDRFVLLGIIKQSALGALGIKITDYIVQSSSGGDEADGMPGYDGSVLGSCTDDFKRPDYRLAGPVQFAGLVVERSTVSVRPGEEVFVQITADNLLRDQLQRATIKPSAEPGVDVQMHNPANDAYSADLQLDLNKKDSAGASKIGHVAITGKDAGATGSIQVELTTEAGGRVVKTISFVVGDAPSTSATTTETTSGSSEPDNESTPPPTTAAIIGTLALVFLLRRR